MSVRCSATLCRISILTLVAGQALVTLVGCNSAPFHTAGLPGGGKPALTHSPADGTGGDDSGWSGGARAADADQKAQYHEVRAGETLQNVATMYGLTVSRLVTANGLDTAEGLQPGQLLFIPRSP